MSVRAPLLVVAAYVLLSLSWLFTNPAGSAPDETAHYVKALAAGHGRLYLADGRASRRGAAGGPAVTGGRRAGGSLVPSRSGTR